MPNVRIFVDKDVLTIGSERIDAELASLREEICSLLSVPIDACQLAVLPVHGMPDQPRVNMEIQYLATPGRTPDKIADACARFQEIVTNALGSHTAVRATPLDPATYVALK